MKPCYDIMNDNQLRDTAESPSGRLHVAYHLINKKLPIANNLDYWQQSHQQIWYDMTVNNIRQNGTIKGKQWRDHR